MRYRTFNLLPIACCLAAALWGQGRRAPDAYSLTEVNSMIGPNVTMKVFVDGLRVVVDQELPAQGSGAATYVRARYDLQSHKTLTWRPENASGGCSAGSFEGDWGDP